MSHPTGSPRRMSQSAEVTVVAWTRMSTWSPRGVGVGRSTWVNTSGGPYASNITARMRNIMGSG